MPSAEQDLLSGHRAPAATNAPEALTTTAQMCRSVWVAPIRANRDANTSTVWIGFTSTDGAQRVKLAVTDPGYEIVAPKDKQLDLSKIYVDIETVGDGVAYDAVN